MSNEEIHELAARRWDNATSADKIGPGDALRKCLSELQKEDIASVYIICVDREGKSMTYAGGPHVGTINGVWMVLQKQVFRLMEMVARS